MNVYLVSYTECQPEYTLFLDLEIAKRFAEKALLVANSWSDTVGADCKWVNNKEEWQYLINGLSEIRINLLVVNETLIEPIQSEEYKQKLVESRNRLEEYLQGSKV